MEKHPHPFDEFLKEALKGHQLAPPEEAKKAFLKEASTIIPARKGWLRWYYFPVMVILICGTIAFLYFREDNVPGASPEIIAESIKSSQNTGPDSNPVPISTSIPISNSGKEPAVKAISTTAARDITVNEKSANNAAKLLLNNTSDIKAPEIQVNVMPDSPAAPVSTYPGSSVQQGNSVSATTSLRMDPDSLVAPAGRDADTVDETEIALPVTPSSIPPEANPEPDKPAKAGHVSYFAAGAYYLPEWMFNTIEGSKFVNNFGVEGVFYRDRISIRTGLGISISKGITENAVEYNEYLGTYNKLDSVTFIFSESDHDFLPNFHMSEERVWDSNSKLDSTNVIKRYTYLQVPLVLGFDFWQQGRYTAGVRVGTIMSVMLSSKQLSGPYNPGENLVVGIDRITPDQVSVNWQAIGGISASARLTKSIIFEIEPQAKYYYQSIYEKSGNTKKPWSLSIRAAIIYKF